MPRLKIPNWPQSLISHDGQTETWENRKWSSFGKRATLVVVELEEEKQRGEREAIRDYDAIT